MTFTAIRIIFAVMTLSLASCIFLLHYALLSIRIKNKIRKTDHRVPSGMALIPAILAALAWQVSKQREMICYWAIGIVALDPMNWIILAAALREALGKVRKKL
jgi:hypothetical protein